MSGRRWTQEEIELLESMIEKYTVREIAKKLNRSFDAVNLKVNRLGLSGFIKSTEWLTQNELHKLIKVDSRTLRTWKEKYNFPIKRRGGYRMIDVYALSTVKWFKEHQDLYNTSKGDWYFLEDKDWFKEKQKDDKGREKHKQNWSESEVCKLRTMYKRGYTTRQISEEIGRTHYSVRNKLNELNCTGKLF